MPIMLMLLLVGVSEAAAPTGIPSANTISNITSSTNTIISNATTSNTIHVPLTFYGAPAGAVLPVRWAPNYTTVDFISTGYTSTFFINISKSTNSTYHGKIPFQWQGAGTTFEYNGVVYTMLNGAGACSSQILNVNGTNDFCAFYVYLNESLFNSNEVAELKAAHGSLAHAKLVVKQILNTTSFPRYNGTNAAGTVLKSAMDLNGSIIFNTATVVKNPSYICINLTSSAGAWNFCKPGTYQLPLAVIGGHFGLTGSSEINITAKLSSTLIGSQTVPYTARIQAGNTTYLLASSDIANSFSATKTFTYTAGEPLNITLNSGGNANYSAEDPTVTVPANILNYVPLNLSTSWSSVKSAYVQQMVNITESTYSNYLVYNKNFANFEYFYSNGTIIPSWIESNSSGKIITWVKIKNTTTNFYLGFASKTTNLLSSSCTSGIGEAPQLSSTYAEYDNGRCVFPDYWNFAGTTINSSFTLVQSGTQITQNNGITVSTNSSTIYAGLIYTNGYTGIKILDGYVSALSGTGSGLALQNGSTDLSYGYIFASMPQSVAYGSIAGGFSGYDNPNLQISVGIMGGVWLSNNLQVWYKNYTPTAGNQTELSLPSTINPTIAIWGHYSASITIQWLRTRSYPPSGTMPAVSFSAVQAAPTLSISPNPAAYGQSITITATCTPSSDSCAIAYPNLTTTLATGTGTATYTYSAGALGVGTYSSYYAEDKTTGLNSAPQTLTVENAPTLTISPNPSTYGQSVTITATCPSNSDSCAIAYPNLTTTLATGTGTATYTYSAGALGVGTYSSYYAVDKTTASNSTPQTLTINKATPTISLSTKPSASYIYNGTPITATYSISTYHNQLSANLYLNKVAVASTTTSNTYLSGATAGPYDWAFNTTGNANYTSASATPINITISKATPTLSISGCSNYTYNGNSCTETGTITTHNNQLSATYTLNGNTIGTTTTSLTSTEVSAGTYNYELSTAGNSNYTSANTVASYTISKATPTISLSTKPSASYIYNGTPITATYSISTYHNQLSANLYLN
ncbi:MAG: hypothetical protein QXZ36_07615, partial [Thermoproteota archaeon]